MYGTGLGQFTQSVLDVSKQVVEPRAAYSPRPEDVVQQFIAPTYKTPTYSPRPEDVVQQFIAPTYKTAPTYAPFTFSMPRCVSCDEKAAAGALCEGQTQGVATLNAKWPNVDPCIVRALPYCAGQECVAPPPEVAPPPPIPEAEPPENGMENGTGTGKKALYGILALLTVGGVYAIYRTTKR